MIASAILYNGTVINQAPLYETFFHIPANESIFVFDCVNFLGPIIFGLPFVDGDEGRKRTIFGAYMTTEVLLILIAIAYLFLYKHQALMSFSWFMAFMLISAGDSSMYLVASETPPQRDRALAFALIFAVSQFVSALIPAAAGHLILLCQQFDEVVDTIGFFKNGCFLKNHIISTRYLLCDSVVLRRPSSCLSI